VTSIEQLDNVRKGKPDANLYTWVDSNWNHLRPSVEFGPFKDFRVRKALFLAMDRKNINDGLYGPGWAYQLALNPGFPEAWSYDKIGKLPGMNPDTKAADIAEAGKLLTAAGFPNGKGINFEILCSGTTTHVENATRFQGQMQSVFPEMKITFKPSADSPSFAVPQAEGRFQMIAYVITAAPDAVIDMSSQYRTGGSRNYGHFSEPKLDAVLDKAAVELNQPARAKLLDEFQQKFYDEWMPMFVLCANPVKNLLQGDIGGYDTTAGTWFGYSATTKLGRWFYVDK
jgi:peptide/nickel transport system substrate-binding protein